MSSSKVLKRWANDPVRFVRKVFKAEPDAWQEDALRRVAIHPRVVMSACKGPGKSTVLAWVTWWFLMTRLQAQIMVLSITMDNLKSNLWKELAYWYGKSDVLQAACEVMGERIVMREDPKTWWVWARAFAQDADKEKQADSLAGFHAKHIMIILDEVGDYPLGVLAAAEAIFAVVDTEAKLVGAGNPTNQDRGLGQIVIRERERWEIIPVTGDPEDPMRSPRIDIEWAREVIKKFGRDNPWVQVNVLGIFPTQPTDRLISANDVLLAQQRDAKPHHFEADAEIWGLDPARFGDDEQALARRRGIVCFRFNYWRGLDGVQLAQRVATMIVDSREAKRGPDAVFVDVGGVGASAFDHLTHLGYGGLVIAVDFGGAADDGAMYDKRTEMWWRMGQWLKTKPSCLPIDNILASELPAPKISFRVVQRQTKFILESKPDMKKRGTPSPNRADALALTFAAPVAPLSLRRAMATMGVTKCVTEDDSHEGRVVHEHDFYHDPLHPEGDRRLQ